MDENFNQQTPDRASSPLESDVQHVMNHHVLLTHAKNVNCDHEGDADDAKLKNNNLPTNYHIDKDHSEHNRSRKSSATEISENNSSPSTKKHATEAGDSRRVSFTSSAENVDILSDHETEPNAKEEFELSKQPIQTETSAYQNSDTESAPVVSNENATKRYSLSEPAADLDEFTALEAQCEEEAKQETEVIENGATLEQDDNNGNEKDEQEEHIEQSEVHLIPNGDDSVDDSHISKMPPNEMKENGSHEENQAEGKHDENAEKQHHEDDTLESRDDTRVSPIEEITQEKDESDLCVSSPSEQKLVFHNENGENVDNVPETNHTESNENILNKNEEGEQIEETEDEFQVKNSVQLTTENEFGEGEMDTDKENEAKTNLRVPQDEVETYQEISEECNQENGKDEEPNLHENDAVEHGDNEEQQEIVICEEADETLQESGEKPNKEAETENLIGENEQKVDEPTETNASTTFSGDIYNKSSAEDDKLDVGEDTNENEHGHQQAINDDENIEENHVSQLEEETKLEERQESSTEAMAENRESEEVKVVEVDHLGAVPNTKSDENDDDLLESNNNNKLFEPDVETVLIHEIKQNGAVVEATAEEELMLEQFGSESPPRRISNEMALNAKPAKSAVKASAVSNKKIPENKTISLTPIAKPIGRQEIVDKQLQSPQKTQNQSPRASTTGAQRGRSRGGNTSIPSSASSRPIAAPKSASNLARRTQSQSPSRTSVEESMKIAKNVDMRAIFGKSDTHEERKKRRDEYIQKKKAAAEEKQTVDKEQRRKEAEAAFQAWLERKSQERKRAKSTGRALVTEINKEVSEDEKLKHRAEAQAAFQAWLERKKEEQKEKKRQAVLGGLSGQQGSTGQPQFNSPPSNFSRPPGPQPSGKVRQTFDKSNSNSNNFSSPNSVSSNQTPMQLPPLNVPTGNDPELAARLSSAERNNRSLMEELMKMQNSFRSFQRQQEDALNQEQEARRRLEAALRSQSDAMGRVADKLKSSEANANALPAQDVEEQKRSRAQLEANLMRMTQDLSHLKSVVDRQGNDIMMLNNDIKNRPTVDPNKMNNTQHLDAGMRDLHNQLMQMRQQVEGEVGERRRVDQEQAMNLNRLQAAIADQEARRNDILRQLAMNDNNKNQMSEEAKKLNDKISLITDEVTRNMMAKEQSIRDENTQKYLVLEKAIKAELEARLQYERDVRQYLETRWKQYAEELDAIKGSQQGERQKQKDRMAKMNEALAVLERQMEQGNKKIDRVMAAEIQSRKLHEKGLLAKLNDIEDRLGGHMGSLNKALDDVRRDTANKPEIPTIDHDAIRRDMEAIANDKHKLSMEGLIKLEDKMDRIQKGVERDNSELKNKLDHVEAKAVEAKSKSEEAHGKAEDARAKANELKDTPKNRGGGGDVDDDTIARLRHQLNKVDETQKEMEKSHEKMRDKVEKQIPNDLSELSLKVDNNKKTLNDRIDVEERERYLAVKELQDEVVKLKNRPSRGIVSGDTTNNAPSSEVAKYKNDKLEKDVEECQIGIKKLAESVTTVKSVMERKLGEEARTREKDVDGLQDQIDAIKKK